MLTPPSTNLAAIPRPAFGRAAQHLPPVNSPRRTRAAARYQRAARTAAELLPDLPEPGEAVHALMLGTFDLCQVIVSIANRLPGSRALRIATLCYNKRNAAELLGLIESRPGLPLTLLTSSFFRSHNKELHEWFAEQLRDQRT